MIIGTDIASNALKLFLFRIAKPILGILYPLLIISRIKGASQFLFFKVLAAIVLPSRFSANLYFLLAYVACLTF